MSSTRGATVTFEGHMRGIFQSERVNMLRMSEVNEVGHLIGTLKLDMQYKPKKATKIPTKYLITKPQAAI